MVGTGGKRPGAGKPKKDAEERAYDRWCKLKNKVPFKLYQLISGLGEAKDMSPTDRSKLIRAIQPLLDYQFPKVPTQVIQEIKQVSTISIRDVLLEMQENDSNNDEDGPDGTAIGSSDGDAAAGDQEVEGDKDTVPATPDTREA